MHGGTQLVARSQEEGLVDGRRPFKRDAPGLTGKNRPPAKRAVPGGEEARLIEETVGLDRQLGAVVSFR